MSTMQLVSSYTLSPGQDYLSGSMNLPCVDTGIDIDEASPWGRIYLCEDTVGTMASLFGWIPPQVAEQMQARTLEAEAEAELLRERNRELSEALDALRVVA